MSLTLDSGYSSVVSSVGKICWRRDKLHTPVFLGFPGGSAGKELASSAGELGSIPGLGGFLGEGNGYPFQYSGLENCMDCISPWGYKEWGTTEWLSLALWWSRSTLKLLHKAFPHQLRSQQSIFFLTFHWRQGNFIHIVWFLVQKRVQVQQEEMPNVISLWICHSAWHKSGAWHRERWRLIYWSLYAIPRGQLQVFNKQIA